MAGHTEELFNEIYDRTNKRILIYITGKCCRTEDISDIFQETYMELFMFLQRKDWSKINSEEAFLIKIAKSKIYKHYTFAEKMKNFFAKSLDEEERFPINESDLSLSVEDRVIKQEQAEIAWQFLQDKDELTRKIFYLYYYEEVPIAQIAELLSVGESMVKNRLYRTLKELRRKCFQEIWIDQ